jgi:hypothetical protein
MPQVVDLLDGLSSSTSLHCQLLPLDSLVHEKKMQIFPYMPLLILIMPPYQIQCNFKGSFYILSGHHITFLNVNFLFDR